MIYKRKYIVIFTLYAGILLISSCLSTPASSSTFDPYEIAVREKAISFFATFADRSDWEKFCSFYRTDVKFRDITLQLDLDSLWQLKRFYKWDEEGDRFQKLTPDQQHLQVESLVVEGNTAVARGYLNPFYYDGNLIDTEWGMDFTIWLYFDEELNIIEQIDWFEYAPEVLESVIQRCRENGHEKTPEWLDLSPR